MRAAIERSLIGVTALMKDQTFESIDEANAYLKRVLEDGGLPSAHADTPLAQAQQIAYDAMEATGQRRVALARRALEISQDCADAWVLQAATVLARCEEFCARFGYDTVRRRCGAIVDALAAHPAAPLMRGDADLWSACIVYAACREAGLIRPAKGGSPLARQIASFFSCELASIRSKVTTLKRYLAEMPNAKD
ncbi:hypothetical protein FGU65_11095 [Methanoculleus sp. FWC-SCC1]|uniref:DUF6398 domain-containing protein n=1 Tax=Methanoculleus frigidifontis TaxID=2584085 RepID=A0ABT8MBX8_9EURY|nr:DUF6398 domain-containing protein [Methanoculleus sp. FWC-SCC1]MDN7025435.1 hypothetical protein [Methanoculleus sp. FWC-SCC1]